LLRQLLRASESIRTRSLLLSAQAPPDARLAGAAESRFDAAFPSAEAGLGLVPASYDAAHYLAYALAAAARGGGSPSARDVAAGLENVTAAGREQVDVGPSGLVRARELLAAGSPF